MTTTDEIRQRCNEFTKLMVSELDRETIEDYSQFRGVSEDVFKDSDLFYLVFENDAEYDRTHYRGFNLMQLGLENMVGRIIFPVKDVEGNVMGFVGYDNIEKPKYLDSQTPGYVSGLTTFYGMEKFKQYLQEYYDHGKPMVFTEGIVDCLCLRYMGLNAFATLGPTINNVMLSIMRNINCIYIADNDDTGMSITRRLHSKVPQCDVFMYVSEDKKKIDTNEAMKRYDKNILEAALRECEHGIEPSLFLKRI